MSAEDFNDSKRLSDASRSLRLLIRHLSLHGFSYKDLADRLRAHSSWNSNAIKQMVGRDTVLRRSEKLTLLAKEVHFQVRFGLTSIKRDAAVLELLEKIQPLVGDSEDQKQRLAHELTVRIGQSFRRIRTASKNHTWPETMALARFDWRLEKIIVLLVQTQVSDLGYSFCMKIEGRHMNRRVIVGDILNTLGNTYFSGLAYNVTAATDTQAFFQMNMFDPDTLTKNVDPNEIGLECFAISNGESHRSEIPVAFHGLDGHGDPTSGVAVVIRPERFAYFGIHENEFSAVFDRADNPALSETMQAFGAQTISPRIYDETGNLIVSSQVTEAP